MTYGTPRNPYYHRYYTGGTPSGPAYAVTAGLVPISLGSDGGGGVRIPSSFCSIFGLTTTHGRLSSFPGQNYSNTCGVNGPMAAGMQSLAAWYSVACEPHLTSYFSSSPAPTEAIWRPRIISIAEAWFQRATTTIQTLCRDPINQLAAVKGYAIVPSMFFHHGGPNSAGNDSPQRRGNNATRNARPFPNDSRAPGSRPHDSRN